MKAFPSQNFWFVLTLCFIANVYAYPAHADTLEVPSEFATIQSAVNASVEGDTILVAPGIYYENIYIDRTAIHLRSEAGPELTIIDGSNLAQVIKIEAVSSLVIEGFTIQRGSPGVSSWPAGVWIGSGLNITIRNNIVSDNSCESSCVGIGIGIFGNRSGPVLIENNIIENNHGPRCGGGAIGVATAVDLQIIDNVIRDNQCNVGGGIYIRSALAKTIIKNNVIKNNSANINGGGVWTLGVPLSMTQNLITGNTAQSGGGIYTDVELLVANSTSFTNNTVANNFSANGSEVYLRGDIGSNYNDTITFINNSISNDEGLTSLFCDLASPPVLQLDSNNVYSISGSAYGGSCSDIYTGVAGNISEDPMYVDAQNGDFRLNINSPMIDAGNNTASDLPVEDLDGLPRIIDGDGNGFAVVDIGVYEFSDRDSDGVQDISDNCILVPNGPLIPDAGGNVQWDTDGDGYGNMCDGDLNDDGNTNTLDLNLYKLAHRTSPGDANYDVDADFNGDGTINTLDLNIYKGLHRKPPGPSCCAP